MKYIFRFLMACFVFTIAVIHDSFNGVLSKKVLREGFPMYINYVKFGWFKSPEELNQ